jgi:hypothetical protein
VRLVFAPYSINNAGYCDLGSIESCVEASDAFAKAVVELMKQDKHK